jgi:hypothetical protein
VGHDPTVSDEPASGKITSADILQARRGWLVLRDGDEAGTAVEHETAMAFRFFQNLLSGEARQVSAEFWANSAPALEVPPEHE